MATIRAEGRESEADELSVIFTGDDYMRELNLRYLGRDESTDVLAFSMLETTEDEPAVAAGPPLRMLGDVVVSVDTAATQAAEYSHTLERELALLVIHGTLHLLGYDDGDPAGATRMAETQDRVLAAAGF
ncbi:MAG: rRNA maturation RNase YbeY [Firmicutes bacterium]|nr:rRNA maturation RNase YbeY [Bacillota bacterium]